MPILNRIDFKPLSTIDLSRQSSLERRPCGIANPVLREPMTVKVGDLDLGELLQKLLPRIRRLVACDSARIALLDPKGPRRLREWELDYPGKSAEVQHTRLDLGQRGVWLAKLIQAGEPLRVSEAELQNHVLALAKGFKSLCHLPLPGRIQAVLTLASLHKAIFSDADLPFLKQIAGEVALALDNALAYREFAEVQENVGSERLCLNHETFSGSMFEEIVGSSKPLFRTLEHVARVAPTSCTVLITGESGTGKELVARAIHKRSRRANRPFVRVNCAAIPAALIASELFGHEKGAFTGAGERRLGRFELANGGTIFLDEIGDIPAETQIALLRVLQEREFERVGGSRPVTVDVRVVAATNRDLKAAVDAGTFRLDLFYRLNVFPVHVPPLRERAGDIPLLAKYFIGRYSTAAGKRITNIEKSTLSALQAYPWPGNIRELQNVIERAVILSDRDTFCLDEGWMQPETTRQPDRPGSLAQALLSREREMIEAALRHSGGRIFGPYGAAIKLGVPRSTLESKIRSLRINKHKFKVDERESEKHFAS